MCADEEAPEQAMPCALDGVRRHEHDLTHRTRPRIIAMHPANGAFHHLSPVYARVVFGVLSLTALVGLLLVDNLVLVAVCGWAELGVAICQAGVVAAGAVVAHVAELCGPPCPSLPLPAPPAPSAIPTHHTSWSPLPTMHRYLRQRAEKQVLDAQVQPEIRRLERRIEQLQGEKERLLYDACIQTPVDDAIRRGLQAVPGQPYLTCGTDRESGGPAAPPSLPPGPPSSHAYPPSSDADSASWLALAPTMVYRGDDAREPIPLPSASSDVEIPDLDGLSDANLVDALAEFIAEEPKLTSSVTAEALASSSTAQYFHSPVQVPSASSNAPAQFASSSAVQYFNSPVQIPNESANHAAEDVSLQFSKSSLQEAFVTHVMCDFTPRSPCALPMRKWASVDRLLRHLQPHVPAEVFAQLTPEKLKHLITEWFQVHPAYAGLSFYEWCKQLKDRSDPLARPRSSAVHFPFEHTPR